MTSNKTRAEKALESKKDKLRSGYCQNCDQMIVRNGTQGRKKFCNDACKMTYHRRIAKYLPSKPQKRPYDRTAQMMVNERYAFLVDIETAL